MAGRREHGGDPQQAMRELGTAVPAEALLDLSTGINPVAYRFCPLPGPVWANLPAEGQMASMLAAARDYYGLPEDAGIAAAPGSQALIQLLPRIISVSRAGILGPTYNEHENVWARALDEVHVVDTMPVGKPDSVLVVVNPNNPDGRALGAIELEQAAAAQTEVGSWLVVDEAFGDVRPDLTAVSLCSRFNVIVLKSFGKFFGLAGLRLGFAVASRSVCSQMEAELGPWAISGPAISIGTEALENGPWQEETRQRLAEDSEKLDSLLLANGLSVRGGTSLFRLVEAENAHHLYRDLLEQGVYVRRFAAHPRWLRFGVPDLDDRTRLQAALENLGVN